jgi:hypothetical protein
MRFSPLQAAITALSVFVATVCTASGDDFPTTKTGDIEGAIIPAETLRKWRDIQRDRDIQNMLGVKAEEFWTPSVQDVEFIEARLKGALEKGAKDPITLNPGVQTLRDQKSFSEEIGRILSHYGEYRRQYLGLIIEGKRRVLINSFGPHAAEGYTKNYVMVFDGGFWFWHALYSMDEQRILWLGINGEA